MFVESGVFECDEAFTGEMCIRDRLSIAAILLGIYLVISKDTTMLHISLAQLPWLLCIGIVHTALAYYLYFHALAHLALSLIHI